MTGYLEKQGTRPYGSQIQMLSKKVMKQVKKEIMCIHMYAHHNFFGKDDIVVEGVLYSVSVCADCGYVSVFDPDGYPE